MGEKSKIEWKGIPLYGNYSVSTEGEILSKTNKIMKHLKNGTGHHYVFLYDGKGNSKKEYIHRLVLKAFKGYKEYPTFECRHLDGNPDNNKLTNLEWGTKALNQIDRIRHGTIKFGENHKDAVLTEEQVKLIKNSSESSRKLGKKFGVSHTTILEIIRGNSWRYLDEKIKVLQIL